MTSAKSTPAAVTSSQYGQSIWYDNVRRSSLTNGEFARLVSQGVRGCTSNPTIFHNAIAGSSDYDEAFRRLVTEGRTSEEIYYQLVCEDIRGAADILFPIFEESAMLDGYVSVEVRPENSHDVEATVKEALWLRERISRRNVMIKVPATEAGLVAITRLIGQGVSVNVTLIFSQERYAEVAEAYIAGLEEAAKAGLDLTRIASVASFFVSRIDGSIDAQLAKKGNKSLLGKVAIANAKLAYEKFGELFGSERFSRLEAKGAQKQRVLWASTGTKNAAYPDTLYVDGLIGPDTVNTVPPATLTAFQDHGTPGATLQADLDGAKAQLAELAALDVNLNGVCQRLLEDGLVAFETSMIGLMDVIQARRDALLESSRDRQSYALGQSGQGVIDALELAASSQLMAGIWSKKASTFTDEAEAEASIKNRLGWLNAASSMQSHKPALREFAAEAYAAGFRKALLLGMGGSSLCPEVLALTFGRTPGFLELQILDSTDPAAVRAKQNWANVDETLFLVSSKSGSTIEVRSLAAHFWKLAEQRFPGRAGSRFVAITDPGSPLAGQAASLGYRRVFENPPDIGGRYSAISLFGLVPAALMGIDLDGLLEDAERMARSCSAAVPVRENPGALLGTFIGGLAKANPKRNKLTLIASPEVASLGSWIEQLVAESTGKHGKGIVPIDLEPLAGSEAYGPDRAFVYLRFGDSGQTELDSRVKSLIAAGHPVATLRILTKTDIGGEFYRWEMATAVAGALLGVNPFDEPNVTEAKAATKRLIDAFESTGKLTVEPGLAPDSPEPLDVLRGAKPGDYVAISAFIQQTPKTDSVFTSIRAALQKKRSLATTLGYGPRFLHSTGQLHKGGPNDGIFILITGQSDSDVEIPGEKYTFKTLIDAQAIGDLNVLRDPHQRRVVHIELGRDIGAGLETLRRNLEKL